MEVYKIVKYKIKRQKADNRTNQFRKNVLRQPSLHSRWLRNGVVSVLSDSHFKYFLIVKVPKPCLFQLTEDVVQSSFQVLVGLAETLSKDAVALLYLIEVVSNNVLAFLSSFHNLNF